MLSSNKTKIVCTIGPASESPKIMRQMLHAGMNVARLNFSHGEFAWHKSVIENLRRLAKEEGRALAIMADLPGPKIRIGQLAQELVDLNAGDTFTLTTEEITGDETRAFVSLPNLPKAVTPGDTLYLNDGIIQLKVVSVSGADVQCRVVVGGELRSRKGLNLPGINLGISAFTDHDRDCLAFALKNGVDAVSQSFVESAADIEAVRNAAAELGYRPFVIAKIERAGALERVEEIMQAADGVMIARGDLGVETPIERIAVIQRQLTRSANQMGKPVITATQMLESMVEHKRPTRAEATDVANAILYGTDCVMLSEESAMGRFPVEAVQMLARIATATEPHRSDIRVLEDTEKQHTSGSDQFVDLISRNVQQTAEQLNPAAVMVPTVTGHTARMVSRFKLPVWVVAVSPERATCQGLVFSYGVTPVCAAEHDRDWKAFSRQWLENQGLDTGPVLLTEGPSREHPDANFRLEILDL